MVRAFYEKGEACVRIGNIKCWVAPNYKRSKTRMCIVAMAFDNVQCAIDIVWSTMHWHKFSAGVPRAQRNVEPMHTVFSLKNHHPLCPENLSLCGN